MILPTATSSRDPLVLARQLILDVGTAAPGESASAVNDPPTADPTPSPKLLNPPADADPTTAEEEGPGTIYITTKKPSASSKPSKDSSASVGSEGDKGILAQAVANSNLSWWQLICIAIAGALVIGVAIWAVFRQRRKKREDEERKKEVEALDKAAEAESGKETQGVKGKPKGGGEEGSDESGWSSQECGSFSDGGTIRPRRRQRRRKRDRYRWGNRRRRRDSYYSSEEDDESDYSYRPSRRSHRHNRHRHSPTPSPPPARSKRQTFRDSVFSTFQSMKHAAIRSKQEEMEKKLRKQLEDEERIEAVRQAKVREANEEIKREREWFELEKEKERLRLEKERTQKRAGSGDSGQLLIPPTNRPPSSASGSSGRRTATRQASFPLPTPRRQPSVPAPPTARVRMPPRGATVDSVWPPPGEELGSDIHQLLGTKPKPTPIRQGTMGGALMSNKGERVAQSVPVKPTRERPTIPTGGLAPAPKGKKKAMASEAGVGGGLEIPEVVGVDHGWPTSRPNPKPLGSNGTGSIGSQTPASGGNKWTDRMRARR